MVSLLMDQGANLRYQNEYGNTALHEAALNGHHSVVKKIVSGKDKKVIDQVNNAGETPLIIAAKYNKIEVALRLFLAGADRKWKAINGETAYDCASRRFEAIKVKSGNTDDSILVRILSKGEGSYPASYRCYEKDGQVEVSVSGRHGKSDQYIYRESVATYNC